LPLPLVEPSERELARIMAKKAKGARGVKDCRWVTVDLSDKTPFAAVNVWLDPKAGYEGVHRVTTSIESKVKDVLPDSRVCIRTEPAGDDMEVIRKLVKDVAESGAIISTSSLYKPNQTNLDRRGESLDRKQSRHC
jgi:divalent metal cation (Fe/Co/Zn/Cd) transporter